MGSAASAVLREGCRVGCSAKTKMKLIFLALFGIVAVGAQKCPPEDVHYFADKEYCDRYTQCREGEFSEQQCPDGLVFDDTITDGRYPCVYPIDVDCGSRSKLQPAQRTGVCLRGTGYFGSGSSSDCGYFYNCVNGVSHEVTCPRSLAFSSLTYRCEWPEDSPDCDAEEYLGFSCPDSEEEAFSASGYKFFASSRDCRDYFICVRGNPRLQLCELGKVFNEAIGACDEPENTSKCQNYYPREELERIREEKALRQKRLEDRRKRAQAKRNL